MCLRCPMGGFPLESALRPAGAFLVGLSGIYRERDRTSSSGVERAQWRGRSACARADIGAVCGVDRRPLLDLSSGENVEGLDDLDIEEAEVRQVPRIVVDGSCPRDAVCPEPNVPGHVGRKTPVHEDVASANGRAGLDLYADLAVA